MRRVAVVGASVAGVNAAQALRDEGFDGALELIDGDRALPYDRPPLSKQILSGAWGDEQCFLRPRQWFDEQRIQLRLGHRVVDVDTTHRRLSLDDGSQAEFDGLVIATGSNARRLTAQVDRPDRLHSLRTSIDAHRLRAELIPGRHLVIIGAGFIGLEAAAVAQTLGLRVTVIESAPSPMQRVFGAGVGRWFEDLHRAHGVEVMCGVTLTAIEYESGKDVVRLAGGTRLEADVVLAAVGASPACDWLAGSGIDIGDGVLCAPDLSTSIPGIVVAGDAARWHNPLFGHSMRVEHWTNAVEQANHAVQTLLGRSAPFAPVPYFWSDQWDAKARFVGVTANHDQVVVDTPRPGSFLALFGGDGHLRGALCVNLPRRLAQYRGAIARRMTWDEALSTLPLHPSENSMSSAVPTHTGGHA